MHAVSRDGMPDRLAAMMVALVSPGWNRRRGSTRRRKLDEGNYHPLAVECFTPRKNLEIHYQPYDLVAVFR